MKYTGIRKLYYSISEISEMLDIKQSVIRYWESEFKDLKPQKNRAGNRIYKKEDIALIRLIHYYVHGKHLSIQEAAEMIRSLREEGLYERKLSEIAPMEEEAAEAAADAAVEPLEEEAEEEMTEAAEDKTQETPPISQEPEIIPLPLQMQASAAEPEEPEENLPFPGESEIADVESSPETAVEAASENAEPRKAETDPVNSEMRELLQKIASNIRDVIAILNESQEE
ncbi:MAG: MerR family transcriptional regulator [Candidatus Neomarinimicrobiota bacterium]|jgi:DNA-binding transcriptional MerR regulator|nr:MerR family transcriptional regulator [Candidatus Neomarinimicrobiota bacterium]MDX9780268.1 MerR family transcriptional regulator [bacterium]